MPLSQGHYGVASTSGLAFQYGFPASSSTSFIWGNGTNLFSAIDTTCNPATDTTWRYLAATKSGSLITVYEDGVFKGSSSAGLVFGSYNFTIGQDTYNTDSNHRSFAGLIDDVGVLDHAPSNSEAGSSENPRVARVWART